MLEKYVHICNPCQILRYHTHILPPSYLINRFSILGTFLLLCFYFSFSFLQFFLIYNLNLKWYIKSIKITTISQLKLHWQAQLSKETLTKDVIKFLFVSLLHKTNRFHVKVFDHRCQNMVRTSFSDTLSYCLVCPILSLPHFDVICNRLLNRCMVIWKLFVISS